MRLPFGANVFPLFADGESVFEESRTRKPRPNEPDPRARKEMKAFDALPAEARRAIAESPFGAVVAELHDQVVRRGASPAARERLKARGLMPCDAGTEGVLLEEVALLEEQERTRIAAEMKT